MGRLGTRGGCSPGSFVRPPVIIGKRLGGCRCVIHEEPSNPVFGGKRGSQLHALIDQTDPHIQFGPKTLFR